MFVVIEKEKNQQILKDLESTKASVFRCKQWPREPKRHIEQEKARQQTVKLRKLWVSMAVRRSHRRGGLHSLMSYRLN
jgi:hypothetical protein